MDYGLCATQNYLAQSMELNQSKTYLDLNIDKCFSVIYWSKKNSEMKPTYVRPIIEYKNVK